MSHMFCGLIILLLNICGFHIFGYLSQNNSEKTVYFILTIIFIIGSLASVPYIMYAILYL